MLNIEIAYKNILLGINKLTNFNISMSLQFLKLTHTSVSVTTRLT